MARVRAVVPDECSRTFVLGAGFSAHAGFPLMRGMKCRVLSVLEGEGPRDPGRFFDEHNPHIKQQFYDGLRKSDADGQLQLEEILIALHRDVGPRRDGRRRYVTLEGLEHGIVRLLWGIHGTRTALCTHYANFGAWLHEHPEGARRNAVLSFNWDVLVEQSAHAAGVPWSYSRKESGVPVLKLHGSINWNRYLKRGLASEYGGWRQIDQESGFSYNGADPFSDFDPQGLNPDLHFLIYPGGHEITRSDVDLQRVWQQAEASIRERDALVFIGYALPEYDCHAVEWLRSTCAGKVIEVVSPSEKVVERYRTMLGGEAQHVALRFEDSDYGWRPPQWRAGGHRRTVGPCIRDRHRQGDGWR